MFIIAALLISLPTYAQIIKVRVTDYGWLTSFPLLRDALDAYLETEEANLNEIQPIKNPDRLFRGIGNSAANSSRGIGTDYATYMENFFVGLSIGAAADFERDVALEDLESGLGASAGAVFGKTISKRLNVYANLGGVSHDKTLTGILDTDLEAEITTFNAGLHLRYDLIPGSDERNGWGGVKTHFGWEYNYNELTFENKLNEELSVDLGGVATVEGRIKGVPRYEITTIVNSFPLEFSTDYRFLNYFSLFGGVGGDLNFGTAKSEGDAKVQIFSPLTCTSGICTNLNLPQVEAEADLDGEEKVDVLSGRIFGGLQANFGQLSAYGMVNQVIDSRILAVSMGMRIVF